MNEAIERALGEIDDVSRRADHVPLDRIEGILAGLVRETAGRCAEIAHTRSLPLAARQIRREFGLDGEGE